MQSRNLTWHKPSTEIAYKHSQSSLTCQKRSHFFADFLLRIDFVLVLCLYVLKMQSSHDDQRSLNNRIEDLERLSQSGNFSKIAVTLATIMKVYEQNVDTLYEETLDLIRLLSERSSKGLDKSNAKTTSSVKKKLAQKPYQSVIPNVVFEEIPLKMMSTQKLDRDKKKKNVQLQKKHDNFSEESGLVDLILYETSGEEVGNKQSFRINNQTLKTIRKDDKVVLNIERDVFEHIDLNFLPSASQPLSQHRTKPSILSNTHFERIHDHDFLVPDILMTESISLSLIEVGSNLTRATQQIAEKAQSVAPRSQKEGIEQDHRTSRPKEQPQQSEKPAMIIVQKSHGQDTSKSVDVNQNVIQGKDPEGQSKSKDVRKKVKVINKVEKPKKTKVIPNVLEDLRQQEERNRRKLLQVQAQIEKAEKAKAANQQATVRPPKKIFKTRNNFRVEEYSTEALSWFDDEKKEDRLEDLFTKNPKWAFHREDVCRFFLSFLHLANEGRTQIIIVFLSPGHPYCFKLSNLPT